MWILVLVLVFSHKKSLMKHKKKIEYCLWTSSSLSLFLFSLGVFDSRTWMPSLRSIKLWVLVITNLIGFALSVEGDCLIQHSYIFLRFDILLEGTHVDLLSDLIWKIILSRCYATRFSTKLNIGLLGLKNNNEVSFISVGECKFIKRQEFYPN